MGDYLSTKFLLRFISCFTLLADVSTSWASENRKPARAETRVFSGRLSVQQREARLEHAKELLGKHYKKSEVRNGEHIKKINSFVYRWTQQRLPEKYKKEYKKIAQTIIDQSLKYEFDPIFLLSVIQRESMFNPDTIGGVGEIGLMQIRPETGQWISKKLGLKWEGLKSLSDPRSNIEIGAAFMNFLRDRYNSHAQLYLAAYNMGQGNVDRAVKRNVWPKIYSSKVMEHYVDFYSELDVTKSRGKDFQKTREAYPKETLNTRTKKASLKG